MSWKFWQLEGGTVCDCMVAVTSAALSRILSTEGVRFYGINRIISAWMQERCVDRWHATVFYVFDVGSSGHAHVLCLVCHVFTLKQLGERFATLPLGHRWTHRGALGPRGAPLCLSRFHVFTLRILGAFTFSFFFSFLKLVGFTSLP